MKRIVQTGLMLALCLSATPARGQVVMGMLFGELLSSDDFNVGFDIGMNFANVTGLDATRKNGTRFGLFADWRFSNHLHFTGGFVAVSSKGATDIAPGLLPLNDPDLDPLVENGLVSRDLGHIDFPLVLKYAFKRNSGLRIGAGGQFNILTSAKDRYSARSDAGSLAIVERDIKGDLNTFDAGLVFDVEYRIGTSGIAIGVQYYHGLTDMDKSSDISSMNRVLSGSGRISLGGRGKKDKGKE